MKSFFQGFVGLLLLFGGISEKAYSKVWDVVIRGNEIIVEHLNDHAMKCKFQYNGKDLFLRLEDNHPQREKNGKITSNQDFAPYIRFTNENGRPLTDDELKKIISEERTLGVNITFSTFSGNFLLHFITRYEKDQTYSWEDPRPLRNQYVYEVWIDKK